MPTCAKLEATRGRRWALPLLATAALTVAGCGGLEPAEQEMLVVHQQNSKIYYDRGDLPRAEQQARLGLEINDNDRSLKLLLAYVLLRQNTDASLEEALDLLSGLGGSRSEDYRVHLGRGLVETSWFRLRREDDPEDAAKHLARARRAMRSVVELEPDCTEAYYHLALLDLEEENFDQFNQHVETTLTLVGRSLKAKDVALEQVGRPEQRQLIVRDRQVDAGRGRELLLLRAERAYQQKRYADAVRDLDRMADLGDLSRADYFNRARILHEVGDLERAVADYERFIELSDAGLDARVEVALDNLFQLRAQIAEGRTREVDGE